MCVKKEKSMLSGGPMFPQAAWHCRFRGLKQQSARVTKLYTSVSLQEPQLNDTSRTPQLASQSHTVQSACCNKFNLQSLTAWHVQQLSGCSNKNPAAKMHGKILSTFALHIHLVSDELTYPKQHIALNALSSKAAADHSKQQWGMSSVLHPFWAHSSTKFGHTIIAKLLMLKHLNICPDVTNHWRS